MREPLELQMGQVVTLKKVHPCGSFQWEVVRLGMDVRLRCQGCDRYVLFPRSQLERRVKRIDPPGPEAA